MKTREECQAEVSRPGKFEHCHIYAPYFWDAFLNGGSSDEIDINDRWVSVFHVLKDDEAMFPELAPYTYVLLWEDGSGFVHCIPTNELPPVDDIGEEI